MALATIGLMGRLRPRRAGRYPIRTSSVVYNRPKSWACPSGTSDAAEEIVDLVTDERADLVVIGKGITRNIARSDHDTGIQGN
jgi:hypothetical protein